MALTLMSIHHVSFSSTFEWPGSLVHMSIIITLLITVLLLAFKRGFFLLTPQSLGTSLLVKTVGLRSKSAGVCVR